MDYKSLSDHYGHTIVVAKYSNQDHDDFNITIECEDCNEVLIDFYNPQFNQESK